MLLPDGNQGCPLRDPALLELRYEQSLPMDSFPVEPAQVRVSTAAYQAERDLDSLMYQDSGMYRNQQYGKAEAVTLRTMYEEIPILWDQELKYRPSFSVVDQTVTMPVLLEKICGVKDGQTNAYWLELKKLVTPDTLVVRSVPWLAGTDAGRVFVALERRELARHTDDFSDQTAFADKYRLHHAKVGLTGNSYDRSVNSVY